MSVFKWKVQTAALSVLLFIVPQYVSLGWGGGHPLEAAYLWDCLPSEIRLGCSERIKTEFMSKYCFYPDSDKAPDSETLGEDAARLVSVGITHRSDLHSAAGRAECFNLLVMALRSKNYERAAAYIGILLHITGDMGSCLHDPWLHYCDFLGRSGLAPKKYPARLDLSYLGEYQSGMIKRTLADYKPKLLSASPDEVLAEILMKECRDTELTLRLSRDIAESLHDETDETLKKLLCGILIRQLKDTVDIVHTARFFAGGSGWSPDMTGVHRIFAEKENTFQKEQRLSLDPFLGPELARRGGAGLIAEPFRYWFRTMLNPQRHLFTAWIAEFKRRAVPFSIIDLRKILSGEDRLDPKTTPAAVVFSGRCKNTLWMKVSALDTALSDYLRSGGKILWIGGNPVPVIESKLPNMRKGAGLYPLPGNQMRRSQPELSVFYQSLAPEKLTWSFPDEFMLTGGWLHPECPWFFDDEKNIIPLAWIKLDNQKLMVAAMSADRSCIFIPAYLAEPYFIMPPSNFQLYPNLPDPVSSFIILRSLSLLGIHSELPVTNGKTSGSVSSETDQNTE